MSFIYLFVKKKKKAKKEWLGVKESNCMVPKFEVFASSPLSSPIYMVKVNPKPYTY